MTDIQVKERMIKRLSMTYKAYLFYNEKTYRLLLKKRGAGAG